jgi:hypothetical protein
MDIKDIEAIRSHLDHWQTWNFKHHAYELENAIEFIEKTPLLKDADLYTQHNVLRARQDFDSFSRSKTMRDKEYYFGAASFTCAAVLSRLKNRAASEDEKK